MKTANKTKHLYARAGFGLSATRWEQASSMSVKKLFGHAREYAPIRIVEKPQPTREEMSGVKRRKTKESKMQARENVLLLNTTWTEKLYSSEAVLREKMTLFWHDHFACRVMAPYMAQQQNNTLRQHALGKFGDLLQAISKDPAMLQFLNNQQNKKGSPNENFAREVLELFTLGRGHYTEEDIKNAARAFTGWAFNPVTGDYVFRQRVHDTGTKTFRGKTGIFSGEQILSMVLEDKQTARFITQKIWNYLVSHEVTDDLIIGTLAESFYKSDYNIEKLLTTIFSSSWFYDDRYVGNRIKSPVELLAGILTHTGGQFENPNSLVFIQRALGQVLFQPPNVGGWPLGKEWIDSSSLTFRLSLPSVLLKNTTTDFEAKDDGDANNAANTAKANKLVFNIDWKPLADQFTKTSATESLARIEDYLLARPATNGNRKMVSEQANKSAGDIEFMQKAFTGFMSLPEYQLC